MILYRRRTRRRPHEQVMVLLANLHALEENLNAGAIAVIDDRGIRIRRADTGGDQQCRGPITAGSECRVSTSHLRHRARDVIPVDRPSWDRSTTIVETFPHRRRDDRASLRLATSKQPFDQPRKWPTRRRRHISGGCSGGPLSPAILGDLVDPGDDHLDVISKGEQVSGIRTSRLAPALVPLHGGSSEVVVVSTGVGNAARGGKHGDELGKFQ